MICPSEHVRSQKHLSECPSAFEVVPQVGRPEALQTLVVSHRPTCLVRLRVRVHIRTHMRVEVGRWDTTNNGNGLRRPTCGTTCAEAGQR